jgi:hypothetical protein
MLGERAFQQTVGIHIGTKSTPRRLRISLYINIYISILSDWYGIPKLMFHTFTVAIIYIYVYIDTNYKHCTWRSATAVKTLVQECCEKSVVLFFTNYRINQKGLIYIYLYIVISFHYINGRENRRGNHGHTRHRTKTNKNCISRCRSRCEADLAVSVAFFITNAMW